MLLMPSRYHEFAGYSALEAMAAGVPVIASRLGALPEIRRRRALPPMAPDAVAARMRALGASPSSAARGRSAGRAAARAHSRRATLSRSSSYRARRSRQ